MEDGDVRMSSVDNRIVQMQFNNEQFESGVSTTMNTLDKLKQKLRMTDSKSNIDELANSLKNLGSSSLETIASGVDSLANRFSTLGIIGMTALQNITNSAMNLGSQLVNAVSFDAVRDGFAEYETQMNAIQTILSNTRKEGTTVDTVNAALDELNTYADKTIYNFTEMTRNIGTFTAAGVDLQTSVDAIQGIANLAAVSGSSSTDASRAMYQLSQALATGTVKLMDWNSVVTAGMGGEVFQEALKETSAELQTGAEAAIEANGSFRESLSTGWLTSEVLTETLKKFTTSGMFEYVGKYCDMSAEAVEQAYDEALARQESGTAAEKQAAAIEEVSQALADQSGASKDSIKEAMELAFDAENAATKVKTFSQLIDTLKEALGSGWTMSWRTIIGDFEDAEELWTTVNDELSGMVNKSSDARNAMLKTWAEMGGRTTMLQGFTNIWETLKNVANEVKTAFSEVFPALSADKLMSITNKFAELTGKLKDLTTWADEGDSLGGRIYELASIVSHSFSIILKAAKGVFSGVKEALSGFSPLFSALAGWIGQGIDALKTFLATLDATSDSTNIFTNIGSNLKGVFSDISNAVVNFANSAWTKIKDLGSKIKEQVTDLVNYIKDGGISEAAKSFDLNSFMQILAGGATGVGAIIGFTKIDKLKELVGNIKDFLLDFIKGGLLGKAQDQVGGFRQLLNDLSDALNSFTSSIKTGQVLAIAGAIWLMTNAIAELGDMDLLSIGSALAGIAGSMGILLAGFNKLSGMMSGMKSGGTLKTMGLLLTLAAALKMMAPAIKELGSLSLEDAAQGVVAAGALFAELVGALKFLDGVTISVGTIFETIVIAAALKLLASSMQDIAKMSWEEIGKGLVGLGGVLAELSGALKLLNGVKVPVSTIFETVVVIFAVKQLASAMQDIAKMSWEEIGKGLVGLGGVLAELGTLLYAMSKMTGDIGGIDLFALSTLLLSLKNVTDAMQVFAKMSWEEIGKGLVGLGGALGELALIQGALGELTGFNGLIGGLSLDVGVYALQKIAEALKSLAYYSWDQLQTASDGLAKTLTELAVVQGALGELTGFNGLIGGLSLDVAVQALKPVAEALASLTGYSWDQLQNAADGMSRALVELATISAISGLGSLFITLGGAAIGVAAGNLKTLAEGLKSLIDLGDIPTAPFTAIEKLGKAVSEFSSGLEGADAIGKVSEHLGKLAEGVVAWKDVTVPTNMSTILSKLGKDIKTFNGDVDGADAIASVAEPFGKLANSVKEWGDVSFNWDLVQGEDGKGAGYLSKLALGVKAFNQDGLGSENISKIADPMGVLASSINSWGSTTLNWDLVQGEDGNGAGYLSKLAIGVQAFSNGSIGADALSKVAEPISVLAGAINSWGNTSLNWDLVQGEDGNGAGYLSKLAIGVQAFINAKVGASAIADVAEPMGTLASSIDAWSKTSLNWDLVQGGGGEGDGYLTKLARAIGSFTVITSDELSQVAEPLGTLAKSVAEWGAIEKMPDPEQVSGILTAFATGAQELEGSQAGVALLTKLGDALEPIRKAINSLTYIDINTPLNNLKTFIDTLNSGMPELTSTLDQSISDFAQRITDDIAAMSTNISTQTSTLDGTLQSLYSTVSDQLGSVTNSVNTNYTEISSAFTNLTSAADGVGAGLSSGLGSAVSTVSDCLGQIKTQLDDAAKQFELAGSNYATQLASGISSNSDAPKNSAKQMGSTAAAACNNGYDAAYTAGGHVAEGFANGISNGASAAVNAAAKMGADAVQAAKDASGVASPSKKTYAIARFCVIGAINGLRDNRDSLLNATSDLVTGMIQSVGDTADSLSDEMTLTPSIAPVVDISGAGTAFSALRTMIPNRELADFTSNFKAQTVSAAFKGRTEIEDTYRKNILDSNAKTVDAITSLKDDLSAYTTAVANSETAMYVDGNKLASSIVKPMNKQLGILSKRNR